MAASRSPRSSRQAEILNQELAQARILSTKGHSIYLLPESGPRKTKHPDAIVDGLIMEFKTVTGNERKIKEKFKEAREKAENVFLQIDPLFSRRTVARKLAGIIRSKGHASDRRSAASFRATLACSSNKKTGLFGPAAPWVCSGYSPPKYTQVIII